MYKITPALFIIILLALLGSCKNAPNACFTIVTTPDSIRAGHTVTFNAGCSTDATQYFWDFGNGLNSTSSPSAQTTYDSARTYSVALVVGNSGKSASIIKTIIVNP
jgi:PKD repeat protein